MKNESKTPCTELEEQHSGNLERLLREELDKEAPDRDKVLDALQLLEKRDREQSCQDAEAKRKKRKPIPRWLRVTAAAIAIVIALSLVVPPVFGAENIVELVGRWTDDLFTLFRPGARNCLETECVYRTGNPELQKVYDAVKAVGITDPVVPTWIPVGCIVTKLNVLEVPEGKEIIVLFESGSKYILLNIHPDGESSNRIFPKDDKNAKVYEVAGQTHYILPNEEAWFAAWLLDDRCCSIITNYDEETIRRIVRSIYMEGN